MTLTFNRRKIILTLAVFAFILVLIHSIVLAIYFYVGNPDEFDFVRLIDLDYEGNIPTLFSSLLFLTNGVLLYCLYQATKQAEMPGAGYWLGLALVFTFLGFDEGSRLHEEIGDLFENVVLSEGYLYFPWVIPYSIAFIVAVAIYFRFYLTLERELQVRLFVCAAVFLSGALGVEIISAREADIAGTSSLSYSVLYTIEESLEMAGLILLVDTLLRQFGKHHSEVKVKFS